MAEAHHQCATHPSCKAAANVKREALFGEERKQIAGEGGTPTAKLGVPFHRHGLVTN